MSKLACLARRSTAFSCNVSTLLQVQTSIYSTKAHITSNLFVRGKTLSCFVSLDKKDFAPIICGCENGYRPHFDWGREGGGGIIPTVTICYLLMDKRKNVKSFSLRTKLFLFCLRNRQNNSVPWIAMQSHLHILIALLIY